MSPMDWLNRAPLARWVRRALLARRIRKHHAWIRRNRIVFARPAQDDRRWSDLYMRSYRQ